MRADSIFSKKRLKIQSLLNVLCRYQFMLLAFIGQLYVLLLISASIEFHAVLGIARDTLTNALTLVSLVLLLALATTQWTYPMSNEVPIMVIIAWIMLSTQGNTYCVCCDRRASQGQGGASQEGAGAGNESRIIVTISEQAQLVEYDDDYDGGADYGLYVLEWWESHIKGCSRDSLAFWYTAMALLLLIASLLADMRSYWLALLSRIVAIVTFFSLLFLLVISPGSSSQYNASAYSLVVARITLYHILWFMNQYKDITELVLTVSYTQILRVAKRLVAGHSATTVAQALLATNKKKNIAAAHRKRRTIVCTPAMILDELDCHIELLNTGTHQQHLVSLLGDAVDLHRQHYTDSRIGNALSWKHRSYNRHISQLVNLGRTVWVLYISQWFMWPLVPLMAFWLLHHIERNKREIMHARTHAELIEHYSRVSS
jgi:hypothetical protein